MKSRGKAVLFVIFLAIAILGWLLNRCRNGDMRCRLLMSNREPLDAPSMKFDPPFQSPCATRQENNTPDGIDTGPRMQTGSIADESMQPYGLAGNQVQENGDSVFPHVPTTRNLSAGSAFLEMSHVQKISFDIPETDWEHRINTLNFLVLTADVITEKLMLVSEDGDIPPNIRQMAREARNSFRAGTNSFSEMGSFWEDWQNNDMEPYTLESIDRMSRLVDCGASALNIMGMDARNPDAPDWYREYAAGQLKQIRHWKNFSEKISQEEEAWALKIAREHIGKTCDVSKTPGEVRRRGQLFIVNFPILSFDVPSGWRGPNSVAQVVIDATTGKIVNSMIAE